jgi:hypothetical protein
MPQSKKIARTKRMDYWKRRGAGMPAATQAVYDGEEVTCKQVIIPQRFGAAADLKLMMSL